MRVAPSVETKECQSIVDEHIAMNPTIVKSEIEWVIDNAMFRGNEGYGKDGEVWSEFLKYKIDDLLSTQQAQIPELKKGESWRRGYQQGIKESQAQMREEIKKVRKSYGDDWDRQMEIIGIKRNGSESYMEWLELCMYSKGGYDAAGKLLNILGEEEK